MIIFGHHSNGKLVFWKDKHEIRENQMTFVQKELLVSKLSDSVNVVQWQHGPITIQIDIIPRLMMIPETEYCRRSGR